jgi:predicted Fe-Mo cluster-binding NifX family protein
LPGPPWRTTCGVPGMDRERTSPRSRAAFSCWNGRIAPLFDTARELHVVETEGERIVSRADESLPAGSAERRASRLATLGVATLVCGAISRATREAVASLGVRVVPFVSGDRDEVVRAWLEGGLERPVFTMPGCGGSRWRRENANARKGEVMPRQDGTGPTGKGPGTGRGAGLCAGTGTGAGRGFGRGRGFGLGAGLGGARRRLRAGLGAATPATDAGNAADVAREEEALRTRLDALKQELACVEDGIRALGDAPKKG